VNRQCRAEGLNPTPSSLSDRALDRIVLLFQQFEVVFRYVLDPLAEVHPIPVFAVVEFRISGNLPTAARFDRSWTVSPM